MEEIYPHFIVDKPLGEDFFEGQSQSKLAENISNYNPQNEMYQFSKRNVHFLSGG